MNLLSEALRSSMTETMEREVGRVLQEMAEEAEEKVQALSRTAEQLQQEMQDRVAEKHLHIQARDVERERLEEAVAAVREEERARHLQDDSFRELKEEAERLEAEREKERERRYGLERQNRWLLFQLELKEDERYERSMAKETDAIIREAAVWDGLTRERVNVTLSTAVSAAATKQKLLAELKKQAGKWMQLDASARETSSTQGVPEVLRGWMMREEWRKLQRNEPWLNDHVQSFACRKEIEQATLLNKKLLDRISEKYQKKLKEHMAEKAKKEEKIRAAAAKERQKLIQKMKKDMDKQLKADMEEKMRQEAKERKEAEKLEKKRKKEEKSAESRAQQETAGRRRGFFFWKKSRAP